MFEKNSDLVFKKVRKSFRENKVAIRSSCSDEDNNNIKCKLNVNIKKKNIISE